MDSPLFRTEAIEQQQQKLYGEIVLARNFPATILTIWFCVVMLALVVMFFTAGFTRKETVSGVVMPDTGLLRLTPTHTGTVTDVRVRLGDEVAAGDVLFVLSVERESTAGDTQQAVSEGLHQRMTQLESELGQQQRQSQSRQSTLVTQQTTLAAEIAQYDEQIKVQKQLTDLAMAQSQRFVQLKASAVVSESDVQQKQADVLTQQVQLQALQRARLDRMRALNELQASGVDEPLRASRESSGLKRELVSLRQQLAESEALRSLVVRAPRAGKVTAINVEPGRYVEADTLLATVMPAGSHLEAELYAPTSAVGFVQPGTPVLLRYAAYPYQKFGVQHGTVREVSRSALAMGEWAMNNTDKALLSGDGNSEPLYRIRVQLENEYMTAFGKQHELKPGMQLQASLLLEHRRLSEWVLEPLYSITGEAVITGLDLRLFGGGRRLPVLLQTEASECGLICLAMVATYHGHQIEIQHLRQQFSISRKGTTLDSLLQVAALLHLDSRPVKAPIEHIDQLALPCVLHWDMNHFVVLKSVSAQKLVIHDPAVGVRTLSPAEFSKHFTGIALELEPAHNFVPSKRPPRVGVLAMMGKLRGLREACTRILLLALALELIVIALPFFLQWVVDQVVVTADRDLLVVLGTGFIFLIGMQVGISALRSWLVLSLSTQLSFQWLGNVFRHLLKLPLDYFEKRHVGHIISCFGSISHIQQTLTTGFVQALVDGVLVIGTLAMMLLYSVQLTLVALVAVVLYGLLRLAIFRSLREATAEQIIHEAKQQTHFLESAAGVQSVRLFGRADARRIGWMNMLADQFNAELRIGRIHVAYETAQKFLFGVERIVIIWLAALAVLDHRFSLGMLFAYIAYKDQFAERISALIDKIYDLRMLRLHVDRVADIVLHATEDSAGTVMDTSRLRCVIEVKDIGFRYSMIEPPVIQGLSLTIDAGECVAITGASGCGKTTLIKLMLGLLQPSEGKVLIDDVPIEKLGLDNYRSLIGTVMQDDRLFTGSIADNISFFDAQPDVTWIEQCARTAAIHDEIESMPMGYHTLVGDIGTGLSGGQKQRVLLARALYRRPRILVLDEATSHLDIANEKSINEVVMAMQVTRIIVAHRPDTIAMADRVVVIEEGRIARDFTQSSATSSNRSRNPAGQGRLPSKKDKSP